MDLKEVFVNIFMAFAIAAIDLPGSFFLVAINGFIFIIFWGGCMVRQESETLPVSVSPPFFGCNFVVVVVAIFAIYPLHL